MSHSSKVTLSREGSIWVVRSQSADDGDFEMRLSVQTVPVTSELALQGSASGTLRDFSAVSTIGVTTMTYAATDGVSPANLSGSALPPQPGAGPANFTGGAVSSIPANVGGNATGSFTANFGSFGHGTCTSLEWGLSSGVH